MRAHVIVVVAPRLDELAGFAQPDEHVFVEAFIAQPAVKGFDESILYGLAGLDVVPGHSVNGPAQHGTAGKLRAIVADNDLRRTARQRQPLAVLKLPPYRFKIVLDAHFSHAFSAHGYSVLLPNSQSNSMQIPSAIGSFG